MVSLLDRACNLHVPSGFPNTRYNGSLSTHFSDQQRPAPADVPVFVVLDTGLPTAIQTAFFSYLAGKLPPGAVPSAALERAFTISSGLETIRQSSKSDVEAHLNMVAIKILRLAAEELDSHLQIEREAPVMLARQVESPERGSDGKRLTLKTRTDMAVAELSEEQGVVRAFHLQATGIPALSNPGGELDRLEASLANGGARFETLDVEHQTMLVKLLAAARAHSLKSVSLFDGKSYMIGHVIPHSALPAQTILPLPAQSILLLSPKTPFDTSGTHPAYLTLLLSTAYPAFTDSDALNRVSKIIEASGWTGKAFSSPRIPAEPFLVGSTVNEDDDEVPIQQSTSAKGEAQGGGGINWEIQGEETLSQISTLVLRYPNYRKTTPFHRIHVLPAEHASPHAGPSLPPPSQNASSASLPTTAFPRSIHRTEDSPRPAAMLPLEGVAGVGATGVAYWYELPTGGCGIAKLSREGCARTQERDISLLEKVRQVGIGVKVHGVFGKGEGEEAQYVVLMEDAGVAVERWNLLSTEEKRILIVALLRLHLLAHTTHGDPRADNALVDDQSTTRPRRVVWIDIVGDGKIHTDCEGLECREIKEVVQEMGMSVQEVEDVRSAAVREGLLARTG